VALVLHGKTVYLDQLYPIDHPDPHQWLKPSDLFNLGDHLDHPWSYLVVPLAGYHLVADSTPHLLMYLFFQSFVSFQFLFLLLLFWVLVLGYYPDLYFY